MKLNKKIVAGLAAAGMAVGVPATAEAHTYASRDAAAGMANHVADVHCRAQYRDNCMRAGIWGLQKYAHHWGANGMATLRSGWVCFRIVARPSVYGHGASYVSHNIVCPSV